jgi:hypothetical protein
MIDLNTKYTTKDGKEVKLFTILDNKIFGAIKYDNEWFEFRWHKNGKNMFNSEFDLVEVFDPKSIWVNVYEDYSGIIVGKEYSTKKGALQNTEEFYGYIKTVEINNAR